MTEDFIVTSKAERAGGPSGECFYCHMPIGAKHAADCVLVRKVVKISATIDYDIVVPADWDAEMVNFHRNEGSWCANNAVAELKRVFAEHDTEDAECLCGIMHFHCENAGGLPYLDES